MQLLFPSLEATATKSMVRRAFSSIAFRMLAGYLVVRIITVWRAAEAAPAEVTTTTAIDLNNTDELCTADGLSEFLEQTGSVTSDDIELAYEQCRGDFLHRNKISPLVKQTVDNWVGTDLSRAETNQIFLAYELAFVGPKPKQVPDGFKVDCHRMVNQFQEFRDSLEPLLSRVEIDLNSLLSSGSQEVDENDRELLNFVQYAQFCKSLLSHTLTTSDDAAGDKDLDNNEIII